MEVTLLGTGDAVGVPAPLCGCEYCEESDKRRRPALLVESDSNTFVFDAGPDIKDQLHQMGVTEVDAFYVTHHHFDHAEGLSDMVHAAMSNFLLNGDEYENSQQGKFIQVYAPYDSKKLFNKERNHWFNDLHFDEIDTVQTHEYNEIEINAISVAHGRNTTYAFAILDTKTGEKVVYAPDMAGWRTAYDEKYKNADVLVVEGAEVVGPQIHGTKEDVMKAIKEAEAEEVYLVNVSEHLAEMHTPELEKAGEPYSIVGDFETLI